MVPKREMQEKYEALYVDDLLTDRTAAKNAILTFSRSNRNHIVRAASFHLKMPSDDLTRQVSVDILVEIEEERSDALAPLMRLDSIRPSIKLAERTRHLKAANKFMREELVGSL